MKDCMTPEAFERWLKEGQNRAPLLYSGQVKHIPSSEVSGATAGNVRAQGVSRTGVKPWSGRERLDWAQKAANDKEVKEDWDAEEPK